MAVSPQASGADPLSELEVLSTGKVTLPIWCGTISIANDIDFFAGLHRLPSGRTADRYVTLLGRQSSMRQNEDLPPEPGRSRPRRRRGVRSVRHQAPEASTRDVGHPPAIFPSWRTDKLRRKRVPRYKRERQKEQGCLSRLITFFREILHIEVTNPYTIRAKVKSGWRTRSA